MNLWAVADAQPTVTDNVKALRALLATDPNAVLVAEAEGNVVGSLLAAWNGWRGSFYRLAVHPDHRRRGLASRLVREGKRRLRDRGALRLDAIVAEGEYPAMSFWKSIGYELQIDRSGFVRNLLRRQRAQCRRALTVRRARFETRDEVNGEISANSRENLSRPAGAEDAPWRRRGGCVERGGRPGDICTAK